MPAQIVSLSEGNCGSQTNCLLSLLLSIKKMLFIDSFKPWTMVCNVLKCSFADPEMLKETTAVE